MGMFNPKGRMRFVFGSPIQVNFDKAKSAEQRNEFVQRIGGIIDKQIYLNYKLWPYNYIACDLLMQEDNFRDKYTPEEKKNFEMMIQQAMIHIDFPITDIQERFLKIYANPVLKNRFMNTIIWDWNGTLLNDLELCIASINTLLAERTLPLLNHKSYKEVFSFPVKEYYSSIGFDFSREDFSIPAGEFIRLYNSQVENSPLHASAMEMLWFFKEAGARQFVLSAMKQPMLEKTLKNKNILAFFEAVAGLNDHYAVSKIERGEQLIREFRIHKEDTWMIGDTNHDFEVAEVLGIHCILVANGHQSEKRLKSTGARVISSLKDLRNIFSGV
jgi:phosphoglycolate phosphatase